MARTDRPVRRVIVVDDDDLSRRGMVAILGEDERIAVLASFDHTAALSADFSAADVVVVDAADERNRKDNFPGVNVVREVRRQRGDACTVVVITGHFFDPAVRKRMAEAKADLFFHRTELQSADRFIQVVAEPERETSPVPQMGDETDAFAAGITSWTKVNQGLDFAETAGWLDDRELSDSTNAHSHAFKSIKRSFRNEAELNVVNSDGTQPNRQQDVPSLKQVRRFIDWATQAKGQRRAE